VVVVVQVQQVAQQLELIKVEMVAMALQQALLEHL
jgi:hypothetical protein